MRHRPSPRAASRDNDEDLWGAAPEPSPVPAAASTSRKDVLLTSNYVHVVQNSAWFYPIANNIGRDLASSVPYGQRETNVLLLGAGDLRHVFTTIASRLTAAPDLRVNFVINDVEAAVTARNVLLLRLILNDDSLERAAASPSDGGAALDAASWLYRTYTTLYNQYVDPPSMIAVRRAAELMLEESADLATWASSPLGRVVSFSGDGLALVRELWAGYASFATDAAAHNKRRAAMYKAQGMVFSSGMVAMPRANVANILGLMGGFGAFSESMAEYQSTGEMDAARVLLEGARGPGGESRVRAVNPLLALTARVGDGISLHYGTFPPDSHHLDLALCELKEPALAGAAGPSFPGCLFRPASSSSSSSSSSSGGGKSLSSSAGSKAGSKDKKKAPPAVGGDPAENAALKDRVLRANLAEFAAWALAFKRCASRVRIHAVIGDAVEACDMLRVALSEQRQQQERSQQPAGGVSDGGAYVDGAPSGGASQTVIMGHAPRDGLRTTLSVPHWLAPFDAIDLSNLGDHLGMLNMVIPALHLLAQASPHARLYADVMLKSTSADGTSMALGTAETVLLMSPAVAALLLGIQPEGVDVGFGTHSYFQATMGGALMPAATKAPSTMRMAWQRTGPLLVPQGSGREGGASAPVELSPPLELTPQDLADLTLNVFEKMYAQYDTAVLSARVNAARSNPLALAEVINSGRASLYTPASFARLLHYVCSTRLRLPRGSLHGTVVVHEICSGRTRIGTVMNFASDLQLQCQLLGVAAFSTLAEDPRSLSLEALQDRRPPRFSLPPDCIILPRTAGCMATVAVLVPRKKVPFFWDDSGEVSLRTPPVLVSFDAAEWRNFSQCHVAFVTSADAPAPLIPTASAPPSFAWDGDACVSLFGRRLRATHWRDPTAEVLVTAQVMSGTLGTESPRDINVSLCRADPSRLREPGAINRDPNGILYTVPLSDASRVAVMFASPDDQDGAGLYGRAIPPLAAAVVLPAPVASPSAAAAGGASPLSHHVSASPVTVEVVAPEPFVSDPGSLHNIYLSGKGTLKTGDPNQVPRLKRLVTTVKASTDAARALLAACEAPVVKRGATTYHVRLELKAASGSLRSLAVEVAFPVPVRVQTATVRLSRKSSYVQLLAEPLVTPMATDTQDTPPNPFPVGRAVSGGSLAPLLPSCNLDSMPAVDPIPNRDWLHGLTGFQFPAHERAARSTGVALVDLKDSLLTLMATAIGDNPSPSGENLFARKPFVTLTESAGTGLVGALYLNALRLDLGRCSVVLDVCASIFTAAAAHDVGTEMMRLNRAGAFAMSIVSTPAETHAWKQLLTACVERCAVAPHGPRCEYARPGAAIPLSSEKGGPVFCGCRLGANLTPEFCAAAGKKVAAHSVRAAIPLLFGVVTVDDALKAKFGDKWGGDKPAGSSEGTKKKKEGSGAGSMPSEPRHMCDACGVKESSSLCGKCKAVRYCSRECQAAHWKAGHKLVCGTGGLAAGLN